MKKVVIFGAGDIARLAKFYFDTDSEMEVVGFCVDRAYRTADQFQGLALVDFEEVLSRFPPDAYGMFVALSYSEMNQVRADKVRAAREKGYTLVSYVSSRCSYLSQFPPGHNCFILEDNTIQPFVRIGDNVTLWSGNHIGHDSIIGSHCFISSHVVVSGHVHIGQFCFLGVNATLRNSIKIADRTLIGAGAIIMRDTEVEQVYVPERTKPFPKRSSEIKL